MESASRGGFEIGGEKINKIGKYSFKQTKIKNTNYKPQNTEMPRRTVSCFFCGEAIGNIRAHREVCEGKKNKCSICSNQGHLLKVCRNKKKIHTVNASNEESFVNDEMNDTYNINIFCI